MLEHLGAHVLEVVLQFDLFGHSHAVMRDRRSAPLFIDGHVSAARPEGDLHRIGECVNASLELSTRFGVEHQLFCRHLPASRCRLAGDRQQFLECGEIPVDPVITELQYQRLRHLETAEAIRFG